MRKKFGVTERKIVKIITLLAVFVTSLFSINKKDVDAETYIVGGDADDPGDTLNSGVHYVNVDAGESVPSGGKVIVAGGDGRVVNSDVSGYISSGSSNVVGGGDRYETQDLLRQITDTSGGGSHSDHSDHSNWHNNIFLVDSLISGVISGQKAIAKDQYSGTATFRLNNSSYTNSPVEAGIWLDGQNLWKKTITFGMQDAEDKNPDTYLYTTDFTWIAPQKIQSQIQGAINTSPASVDVNRENVKGDNTTTITQNIDDKLRGTVGIVTDYATIDGGKRITKNKTVTLSLTKDHFLASTEVDQIIISNNAGFTNSRTLKWTDVSSLDKQICSITNWTLESSADGEKTVYVKYKDVSGKFTEPFIDSIIYDTTPPTGTLAINGGADSTNQPNVMISMAAFDTNGVSQMMISNKPDFSGALWESYKDTRYGWPIDSAVTGEKTVYVKYKDNVGNISTVASDNINYTMGEVVIVNDKIVPFSFVNSVQHYQSIRLYDLSSVLVTGPNSPIELLDYNKYNNLISSNTFLDGDTPSYSLRFDITDEKSQLISDMLIDFDFNKQNEEGIKFVISDIQLKKYINGSYQTIKNLSPRYLGKNRYTVAFGNDDNGNSIIAINKGGKYAIDYATRIITQQIYESDDITIFNVKNEALIKIYDNYYNEFFEPGGVGRKFDIITRVSRAETIYR